MNVLPQLTITLPTYNRVGFLERSLKEHRYIIDAADASFIILDNASTDETDKIAEKSFMKGETVRYYRNEHTIPHEKNFERALRYADSDYVWLLGDTYLIPEECFNAVRASIDEDDYDMIIVNVVSRVTDIPDRVYSDREELMKDLGWHMTCISALVYSRRLLKDANYARYYDTNFLQTGIIFEYLSDKPFKVKWISRHSVLGLEVFGLRKKSWEAVTFEVWTQRWANFVFSLPASYSLDSKMKCIMDHGMKSGVFTFKALKRLRKRNIFNREVYRQFSPYFPLTIRYPVVLLKIFAALPSWVLKLI